MKADPCILCEVAARRVRARVFAATPRAIGLVNDAEPQSRGHLLFFPRAHVEHLHEADDRDLAEILRLVKRATLALGLDGYNVLQNDGASAGQTVFHLHFHLIPKRGDAEGLRYEWRSDLRWDHDETWRRLRSQSSAPAGGAVHHVDLTVGDLARSTEFYDRVLPLFGFRRGADAEGLPIWAGDGLEIGLQRARDRAEAHDRRSPGLHHLAFHAPDRGTVDRVHEELRRLGVPILDPPAEYPRYAATGYYAVFFADPDGIKLEYVHTPVWPDAPVAPEGA